MGVGVVTSQAAEAELEARIEAMARARVAAPAPAPAPQSPARHLPPPPPGSPRQPPPPQWAPAAAPPHVPELWELPTVRARVIAPLNGHRRHHSRPLASLTECPSRSHCSVAQAELSHFKQDTYSPETLAALDHVRPQLARHRRASSLAEHAVACMS
eukprot:COSAG01_NODE_3826_length_5656_cov_12.085478_3_plen_157_part_00